MLRLLYASLRLGFNKAQDGQDTSEPKIQVNFSIDSRSVETFQNHVGIPTEWVKAPTPRTPVGWAEAETWMDRYCGGQ